MSAPVSSYTASEPSYQFSSSESANTSRLTSTNGSVRSMTSYFKPRAREHSEPRADCVYLQERGPGDFQLKQLDASNANLTFAAAAPTGPYCLTGPVIGMVTNSTARILVEINKHCEITCFLIDAAGNRHSARKMFRARHPGVFEFASLESGTQYSVTLNVPIPGLVKSGFKTLPQSWKANPHAPRFGFVSGNRYAAGQVTTEPHNLWKDVCQKAAKNEFDYLIHCGDNVCIGDDMSRTYEGSLSAGVACRWKAARQLLMSLHPTEWESRAAEICELCRSVYRETWNQPATKNALANVPNLMALGPRDIRAAFGSNFSDSDSNSMDFFIATQFYHVYNQYQRNLYEAYDYTDAPREGSGSKRAHHFHVFGEIGVMVMDTIASRTFHRAEEDAQDFPFLGSQQWADVQHALKNGGYFKQCRVLFVICPEPICPAAPKSKDIGIGWDSSLHVAETSMFLQLLFDWRAANPGRREVSIISSEDGEGGYTDISDYRYSVQGDKRLDRIKQVLCGSIASPSSHRKREGTQHVAHVLGGMHHFAHYSLTSMQTFHTVSVWCHDGLKGGEGDIRCLYEMYGAEKKKKKFPPVSSTFRGSMLGSGILNCFSSNGCIGNQGCGTATNRFQHERVALPRGTSS